MTLAENNAIEAELLRAAEDCEYAASCVRASLGNLYNAVKYPLSDARAAMKAAYNAHVTITMTVGKLVATQAKDN